MSNLGKHGKDVITGFEGMITSEHIYFTGCTQYGLQPKMKEDGTLGPVEFFDASRVQVSGEAFVLDLAEDGTAKVSKKVSKGCDVRERPNR